MQQTTIKQFLYGYDQMKVYIITFVSDLLTFPFFCERIAKISQYK
jgi:hypothetical protein